MANLTRADAVEFMRLAETMPLQIEAVSYPLTEANRALDDLRMGHVSGAAVLNVCG